MSQPSPYPHVRSGHTGDCCGCGGFSYDPAWWHSQCEGMVELERHNILGEADRVRGKIRTLQVKLEDVLARVDGRLARLEAETKS